MRRDCYGDSLELTDQVREMGTFVRLQEVETASPKPATDVRVNQISAFRNPSSILPALSIAESTKTRGARNLMPTRTLIQNSGSDIALPRIKLNLVTSIPSSYRPPRS